MKESSENIYFMERDLTLAGWEPAITAAGMLASDMGMVSTLTLMDSNTLATGSMTRNTELEELSSPMDISMKENGSTTNARGKVNRCILAAHLTKGILLTGNSMAMELASSLMALFTKGSGETEKCMAKASTPILGALRLRATLMEESFKVRHVLSSQKAEEISPNKN